MKKFEEIILERKKNDKKYEYHFDGRIGYVLDTETRTIIVYSNLEKGQEFLEKSVKALNK